VKSQSCSLCISVYSVRGLASRSKMMSKMLYLQSKECLNFSKNGSWWRFTRSSARGYQEGLFCRASTIHNFQLSTTPAEGPGIMSFPHSKWPMFGPREINICQTESATSTDPKIAYKIAHFPLRQKQDDLIGTSAFDTAFAN
jgi:hypothetical protein